MTSISTPEERVAIWQASSRTIRNYLFPLGGAYQVAICRIGLFSYLYLHVYRAARTAGLGTETYYQNVNVAAYQAKSLVYLLFSTVPPSPSVLLAILVMAQVSTLCAIVGLATRPAMIVSVLSNIFLGAMLFSWEPLWSHPYNSGLLAGIGMMFGRAGDVFSLDAVLTRYLQGRRIRTDRATYRWPVLLGLFGTSAVYFGGFYAKWSTPEFTYTLSWAFSDNLRNSISLPWLIYGKPLPWQVEMLANNPWLWKLAALGHLLTQALPMLALFSMNRPFVRLAEGLVFIGGVCLLKEVMGFWNPEWIILAVSFVDWEYFLAAAGLELRLVGPEAPVTGIAWILSFGAAFMLSNLIVIGVRYDDRGSSILYPFSSMNFYSNVAATRPYSDHHHYPFAYGELTLHYRDGSSQNYNCYPAIAKGFATAFSNGTPVEEKLRVQAGEIVAARNTIASAHGAVIDDCSHSLRASDVVALDQYTSIRDIPPYPERVQFVPGQKALIGRWEYNGDRFISAAGQVKLDGMATAILVSSSGLDVDQYEILLANDPWKNYRIGPYIEAKGRWTGTKFTVDSDFATSLPVGWYPVVIRVHEKGGRSYDFSGGVMYR
ncbi:hypothetical protein [Aureimonas leprariae]|uniref:Uncharacterized protein n=1 Tax=Plantimonas leprariae TaxID=2615207 RepID=A0A7V7TUL5_9HYPH|nr:hypothetical protein [Aureimonas leprariae]KAB0675911.1 hypothetical protein F6X38_22530 [Aureimonas leprariae]